MESLMLQTLLMLKLFLFDFMRMNVLRLFVLIFDYWEFLSLFDREFLMGLNLKACRYLTKVSMVRNLSIGPIKFYMLSVLT